MQPMIHKIITRTDHILVCGRQRLHNGIILFEQYSNKSAVVSFIFRVALSITKQLEKLWPRRLQSPVISHQSSSPSLSRRVSIVDGWAREEYWEMQHEALYLAGLMPTC